jgi:hypothetical protein
VLLIAGPLAAVPGLAQQARPALSPEAREGLLDAAKDSGLPAWQREFMVEAAGGDTLVQGTTSRGSTTGVDGTWQQLPPPSARYLHAAVYDPVRDRMVVFGGYSTRDLVNDVWVLSLAGTPEWSQLSPAGTPPSARHLLSAIYDPVRDRIVLFGGLDRAIGYLDDVWALSLGAIPSWSRIVPTGTGPSARARHSAVYDPVGDRMIVFGGYHAGYRGAGAGPLNDTWAMSLSDPPAWTPLSPAGPAPSARYDQSAVYDPPRDRILVFGGFDGKSPLNDAWSLSLRGRAHWRPLNATGSLPTPRLEHSAIFDPAGDRMVVFSGLADGNVSDTWSLSLGGRNVWTRINAQFEPSVRWGHSAIYDPARARMVVFGGTVDGYRLVSEVWGLSLAAAPTWTNLTTPDAQPGPRWGHSAIYDPAHERMVVFGGYDQQLGFLNDAWVLTLVGKPVWTMLQPSGTPPGPREGHAAIYDPVRDRMLVFGGETDITSLTNEVWALSLSGEPAWTQVTPAAGAVPEARADHSAIYDASHDRLVVFGGVGTSAYLGDVWALSLSAPPIWTRLAPTGTLPDARAEHSAIYDPVRERMVVFGGHDIEYFLGDVWTLSLGAVPAWTEITATGSRPAARAGHRAIYDLTRDRMVVSGGFNYSSGSDPSTETWSLSLDRLGWGLLQPAGTLPGTEMHSAVYDPVGDRMLVFGGHGVPNDLWELWWGPPATLLGAPGGAPRPGGAPNLASLQTSPNPSRGEVAITFRLAQAGEVSVRIFDPAGRSVRTLASGMLPAGARIIRWDRYTSTGVLAQPGLYFCEVRANACMSVQRIVLVR